MGKPEREVSSRNRGATERAVVGCGRKKRRRRQGNRGRIRGRMRGCKGIMKVQKGIGEA